MKHYLSFVALAIFSEALFADLDSCNRCIDAQNSCIISCKVLGGSDLSNCVVGCINSYNCSRVCGHSDKNVLDAKKIEDGASNFLRENREIGIGNNIPDPILLSCKEKMGNSDKRIEGEAPHTNPDDVRAELYLIKRRKDFVLNRVLFNHKKKLVHNFKQFRVGNTVCGGNQFKILSQTLGTQNGLESQVGIFSMGRNDGGSLWSEVESRFDDSLGTWVQRNSVYSLDCGVADLAAICADKNRD